jgi:hypothetical protein
MRDVRERIAERAGPGKRGFATSARRGRKKAGRRGRGLDPQRGLPHAAHGVPYHDLGVDYFQPRNTARLQSQFVARLERLGLYVWVHPTA